MHIFQVLIREEKRVMDALLVLDKSTVSGDVIVHLKEKRMQTKVSKLLEAKRNREAFDLLRNYAEVKAYLPKGSKISSIPQVTLVETLV
jgi:hypothetical protein